MRTRASADMVVLIVRDTGLGMDSATLKKLFQLFFTTKPVGEGTGLRLSVIEGIVDLRGGRSRWRAAWARARSSPLCARSAGNVNAQGHQCEFIKLAAA